MYIFVRWHKDKSARARDKEKLHYATQKLQISSNSDLTP